MILFMTKTNLKLGISTFRLKIIVKFTILATRTVIQAIIVDVPPLNDTRYNVVKGGINGQERVHTGTNYQ
jgi:hypothetical protein